MQVYADQRGQRRAGIAKAHILETHAVIRIGALKGVAPALRRCLLQDFNRYQFTVGENIGAGDVEGFTDEVRWKDSARKGMAMPFVERLEHGFRTQLGSWFKGGKELSTGQWQKVALSRAFMRSNAEVLVLDEPTAAMDAAAEAELFEYFHAHTRGRITILISHRFSTVRQADRIAVLEDGRIREYGTHQDRYSSTRTRVGE